MDTIRVMTLWDAEADVWVATSDDVPGLVAEAATMGELVRKLDVLIPELLELNGVIVEPEENIPLHLESEPVDILLPARC